RAVVAAARLADGIIHAEVKAEPDGVYLVEFAVRMPGGRLMEVIRLATGVDLFGAVLAIALGEAPDVTVTRHRAACGWFPPAPQGRVTRLSGMAEIDALPGVVDSHVKFALGGLVRPLRSSGDRSGWVLLEAADRAELAARLDAVRRTLRITVAGA